MMYFPNAFYLYVVLGNMSVEDEYFRYLVDRIGGILLKYSTADFLPVDDLETKADCHKVEIQIKYDSEEEFPMYIDEVVKETGSESVSFQVLDQAISLYMPEKYWTEEKGKAMVEEIKKGFFTVNKGRFKVVLMGENKRFKMVKCFDPK